MPTVHLVGTPNCPLVSARFPNVTMGSQAFYRARKSETFQMLRPVVLSCVQRFRQMPPSDLVWEATVACLTDMGRGSRGRGGGGGRWGDGGVKSADGSNESGAEGITGPLTGGLAPTLRLKPLFYYPDLCRCRPPPPPPTPRLFAGSLPLQPGHPAGPLVISRG